MAETNRRKFLTVAGAGAAAGAVGLTAGPASAATLRSDSARQEVVAHIANHKTSELRLMVGEREVVVHDRDLVTRILNAAGGN